MSDGERNFTRRESRRVSKIPRKRHKATFASVLGELFVTAGVLVLLFLGWQLYWNDAILSAQQSSAASDSIKQFISQDVTPKGATVKSIPAGSSEIPGLKESEYANRSIFAVMYVPRLGENTQRNVSQGYGLDVLNSFEHGVGHYPGTAMPGGVGNFAIAAHRSAYGGGMHKIEQFQLNDPIYIQTKDGWYTYRFRNLEYVRPTALDVLQPVPQEVGAAASQSIITLTTCNPLYSTAERIIAYGVLESFIPGAGNPPPAIAADIAKWTS